MTKQDWLNKCLSWKEKWVASKEQGDKLNDDSNGINIYKFIEILNQNLKEDSIIVSETGSSCYTAAQGLKLNGKQRWICSWAQIEMGSALAMSVGACLGNDRKETVVIIGDGGFNTNPQALAVIKYFNLPIKIFVLQNNGYLSIKNTQDKFFNGLRIGTSVNDGLFFPNIQHLASAYQINSLKIERISTLESSMKTHIMKTNTPLIIEVICPELQEIYPGITASKNENGTLIQNDFSNMFPFLSEKEYNKEMIKDEV